MSKVFETGGPDFVVPRAILRLLAAGREVGALFGGPTRTAEVRAVVETAAVRVSFVAAHRGHDRRWIDAVAGCEYVDDRIRLRE